jgi:putative endonuclease
VESSKTDVTRQRRSLVTRSREPEIPIVSLAAPERGPDVAQGVMLDQESADATAVARPWAVYLLHCDGGKSYTGISPSPQARFEVHQTGKGAAFTRANRPRVLAAVVWFESRSAAASMEARLKALARPAKLEWFREFAAMSAATPATLEDGLASLPRRRR